MQEPHAGVVCKELEGEPSTVGNRKSVVNRRVHQVERRWVLCRIIVAITSANDIEVMAMQVNWVVEYPSGIDVLEDNSHSVTEVELLHSSASGSSKIMRISESKIDVHRGRSVRKVGCEDTIFAAGVSLENGSVLR